MYRIMELSTEGYSRQSSSVPIGTIDGGELSTRETIDGVFEINHEEFDLLLDSQ